MNCYVCDTAGVVTPAVVLCPDCNAGLCPEHLREAVQQRTNNPGLVACQHDTWNAGVARDTGT